MGKRALEGALSTAWKERVRGPSLPILGTRPFLTRVAEYLQSMDKRVTPHLLWRHGSPLALRVVHGNMIRFSFLKDNTSCLEENGLKEGFNDNQEVILEADGSSTRLWGHTESDMTEAT